MNSPAPYSGVLLNERHYRNLIIDHRVAEDFRSNLDLYVKCQPPPLIATGETSIFFKGFILGAIGALIGVIALH